MNGEIFKVLAVLVLAAVLVVTVKSYRDDFALVLSLAVAVIAVIFVTSSVYPSFKEFSRIIEKCDVSSSVFSVPIKSLGIAFLTGFVAETCRDFGQGSLAAKAELVGKCAIFVLSMPLLLEILETALTFAKK